jgi:hypothetical protein
MDHAATSTTSPSKPPEPFGGSPTSGQSLSSSCQPHDQIQVELHGSLVLLSDGGGSLGGSLSEWLTLGRSDSLVEGSCDSLVDGSGGSLVDGSFESLVDGSRESLVDGEESLSDPLVDPLPESLCE